MAREAQTFICEECFAEVRRKSSTQRFCSYECCQKAARLFDPTAEELHKLVWDMPTQHVAEIFGVSDKAVEKRCKKLGVAKPPRGYWAKKHAAAMKKAG
jgi:hypothetical protein